MFFCKSFITQWNKFLPEIKNCLLLRVCVNCQQNFFHTNLSLYKTKAKHEKHSEISTKKLGTHKKKPVVKIWKNMTVQQIAHSTNKDIDSIFEAMLFIKNSNYYDKPDSMIHDLDVIKEIVTINGFRFFISSPEKAVTVHNDHEHAVSKCVSTESLIKRPPVVTIMGHVDHGKTTLLDSLRHSCIVKQEFGGITQHIGAFSVFINKQESVTFLDTPGHAAFYALRSRGASITDIIVLVVAANEGVMEQTSESIQLAKTANVPIIVALNKIDKATENQLKICKESLLAQGIQLEEFGGNVQCVLISALEKINLNELIDAILVQAELLNLKADSQGFVEGIIIDSRKDPHPTAIVQKGTLSKSAILVAGLAHAKVRSLFGDEGHYITHAKPSTPVEILGWRELPMAGDKIIEVESEKTAHEILKHRKKEFYKQKQEEDIVIIHQKNEEHLKDYHQQLEERRKLRRYHKLRVQRTKEIQEDSRLSFSVIIKADVTGSVETILDCLDTYHSTLCLLNIIHYGIGNITLTDVELAHAFNGIIYGFNVSIPDTVKNFAIQRNVKIKYYNVIYQLFEDMKIEINSLLPCIDVEEVLGEANVLQEFLVSEGKHKVPVAGCRCKKGILNKDAIFRVIRNLDVIYDGKISSLYHLKNEVQSIKKDVECGIKLPDKSVHFNLGDTIICYHFVGRSQLVDWDLGF